MCREHGLKDRIKINTVNMNINKRIAYQTAKTILCRMVSIVRILVFGSLVCAAWFCQGSLQIGIVAWA